METQSSSQRTTGHYISHWGVPTQIYSCPNSTQLELAVIQFGPHNERSTYRYATNGAAAYEQGLPPNTYRQELYCASRAPAKWIVDLLEALAGYPLYYHTRLGLYDTVVAGGPIDRNTSPYHNVLICPPGIIERQELGAFRWGPGTIAVVNQLIGLYDSELQYCMQHGGEAFWQKLSRRGIEPLVDVRRPLLF